MHRRLILLAGNTRLDLIVTILSGFFSGLLTICQAWLLSSVINDVFLNGQSLSQVKGILLLILPVTAGRAVLAWLIEVSSHAAAEKIKLDLRSRLLFHILKLGPVFARGQRTGELTTTSVDGIEALEAYFSQYLPQLVISVIVPLSILIVVFPIDLLSGIIFLITAPLIPFFMILIGKGAEIVTKSQYDTLRLLSAHFLDSLQGLTTLKIFGQSKAQARVIAEISEKFRSTTMQVLQVTFLSALALELLATLSTAIIAVEIGFRLLYSRMDFQPALFLLILSPEFYQPLRALGARFHAGMTGTTAAKRIFEILDQPLPAETCPQAAPGIDLQAAEYTIELEHVTFFHAGENTPALQDIHLSIVRGQHIAVVGKTGAGKSTLVSLLLGFHQPAAGKISIILNGPTGRQACAVSPEHIAWVPQKPYLFHDTLAANIRLADPQASMPRVIAAARSAHLYEYIDSLPDKYETVIGEGGARLSSGLAQRLALARAFLKDAPIIILDEPTSSLDPETEYLLEQSMKELAKDRTVITIAHRMNTIYRSDQIIVLDAGRIVEQGTHAELLRKQGNYAGMVHVTSPETSNPEINPVREVPAVQVQPQRITQPSAGSSRQGQNTFLRLIQFLQGSWGLAALSVFIAACTVGSSTALMGTSAWLISTAALHPSVAAISVAVVGVRFFGIARGLFRYSERLISHNVTFRLLTRLRSWFYEKLEPLAPARLAEFRAGDLLARIIGDIDTLENFYVRVISPPLTAAATGIFTSLFLASFHPPLALVFWGFYLGLGLLLPLVSHRLSRKPARHITQLRASLQIRLVDTIQGLPDLLSFGRGSERLAQLAETGRHYAKAQQRMAQVSGLNAAFSTLLPNLAMWTILTLSIPLVANGQLAGPMLACLALLTIASFEAAGQMPAAAQMANTSLAAGGRLFEVVDTSPAVPGALPVPAHIAFPAPAPERNTRSAHLQITGLSFTYPGQAEPAVQDITFELAAGSSIALVGPSGAGKSTIASLLLRFWDFQSGTITLNGESIRQAEQDIVRGQFGLVSQNAYFFNTSIYENLRFARRRVTREEVELAAKAAQVHDFIVSLPKGYDTLIGEHGLRLSGGERQRLAIARVLIKDAPILILDEPTANLDPLTEKKILGTLFSVMKQKTSLLITHRLIGLENAGQILVMDHGRIIERGTHAELTARNGCYRRLLDLQNRMIDEETGGE